MLFISSLLSCSPQSDIATTPLIAASESNHNIEVARFLVEHGANIDYQNKVFDILLFSNLLIIIIITILYSKFLHSMVTHLFKLHVSVATLTS